MLDQSTFNEMVNFRMQNTLIGQSYSDPGKSMTLGKRNKFTKHSGKPKRPLSAYNIFFKSERAKLLLAKKKLGFANMAKEISAKWKSLSDEEHKTFAAEAAIEQKKYRAAVKQWKTQKKVGLQSYVSPSLDALLASTDTETLQRILIEQQLLEQRKLMQDQMQNVLKCNAPRRISMPNMGYNPPVQRRMSLPNMAYSAPVQRRMSNPPDNTSSFHFPLQTLHHQEQNLQPQPQQRFGRRFSMPTQSTNSHELLSQCNDPYFQPDIEIGNCSESTDDSSFDEETANLLINMPLMDMDDNNQEGGKNSTRADKICSSDSPFPELSLNCCNSDDSLDLDGQMETSPDEVSSMLSKIFPKKADDDDFFPKKTDDDDFLDLSDLFD